MTEPRHVEHPDDERFDRITIDIHPRWKESELSGDEWRFSYVITGWRKGEAIVSRELGNLKYALMFLQPTLLGDDMGAYFDQEASKRTRDKCDQPGCAEVATVFLERVKSYSRRGEELVRSSLTPEFRQFCEAHRERGDCSRDDADHNYVEIAKPT